MGYDREDRRPAAPAAADSAGLADAMAQPVKFSHTPELGALAAALAKAQGEMGNAAKSAENPGRKRADGSSSRYTDLAAARDAWRGPLSAHGLALMQMPAACGGRMVLVTMLVHGESGQWLRGDYPIDAPMGDPQRIGSAVTYARRYCGMAVTGLAPEDDDGNAASDHARREAGSRGRAQTPPARPQAGRRDDRPAVSTPDTAEPAWKQLVAFRVQEANDEWQNDLKMNNVPEDRRAELTNPSRCTNGIITRWIDEGVMDAAALAQDGDPAKRDWKKVHAAMASDHHNNRDAFDQDVRAYLEGRRERARAELGLPSPAGGPAA